MHPFGNITGEQEFPSEDIGFKLGLTFLIGGPLLAKRCAAGMITTGAGIALTLLLWVG